MRLLLQDDHLDAALLEGLDFDLDMTAPEFAAMASAMVHRPFHQF